MVDISNSMQRTATDNARDAGRTLELIFQWTLRLALPIVAALAGLVIYWIWFDPGKPEYWLQVIGTLPLLGSMVLVTIWAAGTWL